MAPVPRQQYCFLLRESVLRKFNQRTNLEPATAGLQKKRRKERNGNGQPTAAVLACYLAHTWWSSKHDLLPSPAKPERENLLMAGKGYNSCASIHALDFRYSISNRIGGSAICISQQAISHNEGSPSLPSFTSFPRLDGGPWHLRGSADPVTK